MINKMEDDKVTKFIGYLKKLYGERLISVAFFGSFGTTRFRKDSDIDVFIVLEDGLKTHPKRIEEFTSFFEKLDDEEMKTFVDRINPVIKLKRSFKGFQPLLLDMTIGAKIVYDKGNFFRNELSKLKRKLKKLGAKRIKVGRKWYWDLKPDLKPGEVFEI